MKFISIALALILSCSVAQAECGLASYYGNEHGQTRTASGEHYNSGGLTAAHRTIAFGSTVTVTNQRNGRSVTVRINDRGPFVKGRIIDLSIGAAHAIGMGGTAEVCINGGGGNFLIPFFQGPKASW